MKRLSIALLLVLSFAFAAYALEITVETVDQGSNQGRNSSLAYDDEGNIHVSFVGEYDQSMQYACFDGEQWIVEKVFESYDSVVQTSLALKPDGQPSIAFSTYKWPEGKIMYASFNGTDWEINSVDTGESQSGRGLSLAFDSSGNPAIAYIKDTDSYPEYDLKYAILKDGSWVLDTVISGDYISTSCTLAFDSEGIPHISYAHRTGGVYYDYFWLDSEDTWQQATVDPDADYPAGFTESMALDSFGRPHFVYNNNNAGLLKYSSPEENIHMDLITLPDWFAIDYTSLAVDESDNVHVVFGDDSDGKYLRYAVFDGEAWDISSVVTVGYQNSPSLALDASGNPAISYYDSENYDLKVAVKNGTEWEVQTVPKAGKQVGMYPDMALDSQENPHLVYTGQDGQALKYASKLEGEWKISDMVPYENPPENYFFRAPSIALDQEDLPVVAFPFNNELFYATLRNDTWQYEAISPDLEVQECDLTTDMSGISHVAFTAYDYESTPSGSTPRDVFYAEKMQSGWSVEKVDDGEIYSPRMVVDTEGNVSILYYDNYAKEIRYGKKVEGSWDISHVASNDYYYGLAHAVDSVGISHMAFVKRVQPLDEESFKDAGTSRHSGELIHGVLLDGQWSLEKFDEIEYFYGAREISLVLDPFDNPHISYGTGSMELLPNEFEEEDEKIDLKYAWFDGNTWHTGILAKEYTRDFAMYTSLALDGNDLSHVAYFTGTGVNYATFIPSDETTVPGGGGCNLGALSPSLGLLILPLLMLLRK